MAGSGAGDKERRAVRPFYRVERLDGLMARMIASELAGRRLAPEADEVLRTVGDPGALSRALPGSAQGGQGAIPVQVTARPGGF